MKIITLIFLLCGVFVINQAAASSTNHYAILKQATVFSVSGGFTGAMTQEGQAVVALTKQKDALPTFTKLAHDDSPVAKLYGLLGLQMLATEQFDDELPNALTNKAPVHVLEGCIMGTKDVATLASEIKRGHWALREVAPTIK